MPRRTTPGIFCVEAGWSSDLQDKTSVRSVLKFLHDYDRVKYIYEEVHTVEGLQEVLRQWKQKRYSGYKLGYFAFHGDPGVIKIGHHKVPLGELGEMLKGASTGKSIYFGSCSVLDIKKSEIEAFRRVTKARCIAGYTKDVDWHLSFAFEVLVFGALTQYSHLDAAERYLQKAVPGLIRTLGFKMYYGKPPASS